MSVLEIIKGADNRILRTKSKDVDKVDKKTKKLIEDMIETVIDVKGLGIAASQVGINKRIFIVRLNYDTKEEMIVPMINPKLISKSDETTNEEEGCLSLPGIYGMVKRSKKNRVKFLDQKGSEQVLDLEDLNARIFQHELDHINGILFIDKAKNITASSPIKP